VSKGKNTRQEYGEVDIKVLQSKSSSPNGYFLSPAQAAHLSAFVPGRPAAGQPQLWAQRGELVPGLRQLQHQPPRQPAAQPQPGGLRGLQRRLSAHGWERYWSGKKTRRGFVQKTWKSHFFKIKSPNIWKNSWEFVIFTYQNFFLEERRLKYKSAYALILVTETFGGHSNSSSGIIHYHGNTESFVMEIWFKVLEKSWKAISQHVYEPCLISGRHQLNQTLWFIVI